MINYDNVTLVPRVVSSLKSRSEADTSVLFCGIKLDVPIIATPMPDVCNGKMASVLADMGTLGIIHRFQKIEDEVKEFKSAKQNIYDIYDSCDIPFADNFACAIGATGDYQERFVALYEAGCRIFCIDTANGANIQVEKAIKWIRKWHRKKWEVIHPEEGIFVPYVPKFIDYVYIIAGAVATKEGYAFLAQLEVDAVRVGISGGSACITKTETGVHMPTLESIKECYEYKTGMEGYGRKMPQIIADGGIRMPSDLVKAIAVGADVAFCGSIFAGTSESPGDVMNIDGQLLKLYRGAASFGVQLESSDHEPDYVEGRESMVKYKPGGVAKVVKRFKNGLRSAMSYMDARTIGEFRENVSVEKL